MKIHDIKVPVNTEWLTDEQLSELGQSGSEENALAMINHFYHALEPAEAKKEAASKISKQCYAWLPDVTSDEERTQLEAFHHTDHAECKKRVAEYKARLPQERQTAMGKYWDFCEHVW